MTDAGQPQPAEEPQPEKVNTPASEDDFPAEEASGGAPGWIVTFADMMSLLLCFFVLLLSFSVMDAEKFRAVAESLKEAFSFQVKPIPGEAQMESSFQASDSQRPGETQTIVVKSDSFAERLQEAKKEIDNYIEKAGLSEHIQTKLSSSYLEIVNSNPLNFPPGQAELLESSLQYLDALLPVLKDSDFRIVVEGHTDNVPINTVAYRSNWELSAARAASFVSYLEEHGVDSERLVVHGYGPNRPLAPNDNDENRARNRRIEIMIKSLEEDDAELSEFHLNEMPETASLESNDTP
jgi:chemotaxis protein MotB